MTIRQQDIALSRSNQPLSADSDGLHTDSRINLPAVSQQTQMRLMPAKTERSRTENNFNGSTEQKPDSHQQPGTKSSKSDAGGTFFQSARAPPQMSSAVN